MCSRSARSLVLWSSGHLVTQLGNFCSWQRCMEGCVWRGLKQMHDLWATGSVPLRSGVLQQSQRLSRGADYVLQSTDYGLIFGATRPCWHLLVQHRHRTQQTLAAVLWLSCWIVNVLRVIAGRGSWVGRSRHGVLCVPPVGTLGQVGSCSKAVASWTVWKPQGLLFNTSKNYLCFKLPDQLQELATDTNHFWTSKNFLFLVKFWMLFVKCLEIEIFSWPTTMWGPVISVVCVVRSSVHLFVTCDISETKRVRCLMREKFDSETRIGIRVSRFIWFRVCHLIESTVPPFLVFLGRFFL